MKSDYCVTSESVRQACVTQLPQKNVAMIWLKGNNVVKYAVILADLHNPENRLAPFHIKAQPVKTDGFTLTLFSC